jgi:putative transposase
MPMATSDGTSPKMKAFCQAIHDCSCTLATRKRHSPEQIVRKLMAADRLLAEGKDTAAVCRELGVSEATYHRWRNQFGGLKAEDAKKLKDLERENAALKRLLADAELEKDALREIARGNF